MGKVLAITVRKGGVAKTMTTASLGIGHARQDKKVLLIDSDNQHSLTIDLTGIEITLMPIIGWEITLKRYTSGVKLSYDFTLIDTSLTADSLTVNALVTTYKSLVGEVMKRA